MSGKTYGYARVSTCGQNLDRQIDALLEFGLEPCRMYADKASGKDFQRPAWRKLRARLEEGDTLVIPSIDRLGRDYQEILDEWRIITKERRVAVVVLDMPLLDTRHRVEGVTDTFISDIVLQLMSYVAQMEREGIRQRQAEGIAAAHARGVRFGRPCKQRPDDYPQVKQRYLRGELKRTDAASCLQVSPSTFDRWLRQDECASSASSSPIPS